MPNLLEHYIIEIISEEPYTADWTKQFEDNFIKYVVIADCYGNVEKYESVVSEKEWTKIKEQGYFWG